MCPCFYLFVLLKFDIVYRMIFMVTAYKEAVTLDEMKVRIYSGYTDSGFRIAFYKNVLVIY